MTTVQQWLHNAMAMDRHAEAAPAADTDAVELSEKQRAAVRRGAQVVERYGGVLLADAVGLGKTRMAVQMARRVVRRMGRRGARAERALFLVPARLREEWRRAIGRAGWRVGRDAEAVSHHHLSRAEWVGRPSVVVVDEAHRFRNPQAKRSRNLAKLTARSPVILVTATPVCTRRDDLRTLLGYFLRDEAVKSMVGVGLSEAFDADEEGTFDVVEILEQVVIRRRRPDFGAGGRPAVRFETLEYEAKDEEAWLWRNLEPTLRSLHFAATGEEWPRGLLVNNLLRMWESGAEALRRSLEELIHFHDRWLEAVEAGRRVERPDFKALFGRVDREQRVFPFLYGSESRPPPKGRIKAVGADRRTLEGLLTRLKKMRRSGSGRMEAIVELVADDSRSAYLIFTAYRAAAKAVFDGLRGQGEITTGLVTGEEARATGLGRTTDREVLRRFLGTSGVMPPHRALRVLVATDCLAEGVNLQRCSKLILADLPYSPVKLEQRIGRIARPGSPVDRVTVYLPRPSSWADSLGMRRRLGERLDMAEKMGASHQLARATGLGDADCDEEDEEGGPLAAMTKEERLWRRLQETAEGDEAPPFARAVDGGDHGLWARVRVVAGTERLVWLWIPEGGEEAVVKLSEQLQGLARLADDERPVQPWKPQGRRWEAARRWVRRRTAQLEASRLAPALVGANSQEVWLWRRLREAVRSGAVQADGEQLERWRRRLLRIHPAGIRVEMEELVTQEVDVGRILRFVEGLGEAPESGAVEVEIEACLRV